MPDTQSDNGEIGNDIYRYRTSVGWWNRLLYSEQLLAYLLLFPVFAILISLVSFPFISTIAYSFQNKLIGVEKAEWTGFGNYIYLFKDPIFLKTVINSIIYTILGVGIKCLIGLTAATVLNQPIRYRNFFRALLFAPWAIPAVMTAYLIPDMAHEVLIRNVDPAEAAARAQKRAQEIFDRHYG